MPTIAFFHGIAIRMFFNDHPPPHFHAYRGGDQAKFEIWTGRLMEGRLPAAQRRLVQQWIEMYKTELNAAWTAVCSQQAPERIPGPDADNDN
jgi:hypothetical protein